MTPLLALRNVTWGHGRERAGAAGRPAGGLSMQVEAGQTVALSGPRGAGKTTLLRMICRADPPRSGTILLAGRDLWLGSAAEAARLVAAVPASGPHSPSASLRALLLRARPGGGRGGSAFPADTAQEAALDRVLTRLDLRALADRPYPRLSPRDRLRADVALALMRDPALLVVEERASPEETAALLQILAGLRGSGLSAVMAVPDAGLAASHADCVVPLPMPPERP